MAQGVSRFLAVESCGQCTPCKQDGLAIAELLTRFCISDATDHDVDELASRVDTVTDEARCFLAHQQQRVVNSLLALFPEELAKHLETAPERADPVTPVLIAPLTVLRGDAAEVDEAQAGKQPDWTYDDIDSGATPAERLTRTMRPDSRTSEVEEAIEADRQAVVLGDVLDGEDHAGHEALAVVAVLADRQRLTECTEDHFLVGHHPAHPHGVDVDATGTDAAPSPGEHLGASSGRPPTRRRRRRSVRPW